MASLTPARESRARARYFRGYGIALSTYRKGLALALQKCKATCAQVEQDFEEATAPARQARQQALDQAWQTHAEDVAPVQQALDEALDRANQDYARDMEDSAPE